MKKRGPMEYALYLLSRKPRTEKELRTALKKRGVSSDKIDEVIEKLESWKYIDDAGYAEDFIKIKMKKLYGPGYIRSELLKRGVPDSIIRESLEKFYDEDFVMKLAVERARKMLGDSYDEKLRRRVWNYFARRGLPASEILKRVEEK